MPNLSEINGYAPPTYDPARLENVLNKLKMCPNFGSLMAMEGDFNEIGLTIANVGANKLVLCTIAEEQPHATNVLEDYIIIGDLTSQMAEMSERMIDCLLLFIIKAAAAPAKVINKPKSWQHGPIMYGTPPVPE